MMLKGNKIIILLTHDSSHDSNSSFQYLEVADGQPGVLLGHPLDEGGEVGVDVVRDHGHAGEREERLGEV